MGGLPGLIELLQGRGQLVGVDGSSDTTVADIAYDSRRVRRGSLFVAIPGQHADGHDHALDAARTGAIAVVGERPIAGLTIPLIRVEDARSSLATAAAWHAGFPSRHLGVVGITGTDGKTTTAYLVRAMLEATGRRTGSIGTTDVIVGGEALGNDARMTTPEAPELQGHLAAMRAAGDTWAVVEATSHGLAQHRVDEVAFDVAVLTNLSREHLEFHGSPAAYREAKQLLFSGIARRPGDLDKGFGKHAIINADDAAADAFSRTAADAGAAVLHYGLDGDLASRSGASTADIVGITLEESPKAMRIGMRTPTWEGHVDLRLAGRFNVHNALAAMAVGSALGLDDERSAAALGALASVPGRMQRIDRGQPFTVVVDYAHTAVSLGKVLDELAPPPDADGGLIAVFGSAGERDTGKRPEMGRVAGERCRLVIVTDEDPRGEDRMAIIDAIAAGAEAAGRRRDDDLRLIPDRQAAIDVAMASARPGDTVVLAGKGHEKTIEMADGDRAWDEAAAAIEGLADAGYREDRPPTDP